MAVLTDPVLPKSTSSSVIRRLWKKSVVFLVLAGATGFACIFIKPPASVSEAGVEMKLPEKVLGFEGRTEPTSEAERVLLPPDTEILKRVYTNGRNGQVSMQIVLSGIEHRSIHRPEICLVGQGWTVSSGHVVKVPLKSGRDLDVMVLDISRPQQTMNGKVVTLPALYAYFFVSRDAETPLHRDRIAITNLDLLFHNRSHRWAYVIAMAPILKGFVPDGRDRDETLALLKNFLRETAPDFLKSEMAVAKSSVPAVPVAASR